MFVGAGKVVMASTFPVWLECRGCIDRVSKKGEACLTEFALAGVDDNAVGLKALEQLQQLLFMLSWAGASHQEIVNVGVHKIKATQDLINEALKSLTRVSEAERHAKKFKHTERCCDGAHGGF